MLRLMICLVMFALSVCPQDKSDKFAIYVTGLGDADPVARALIKKMNASKPFAAVAQKDPSKVVVLVSCMDRKQEQPHACMYVSHHNGTTSKSFLGAGMYVAISADDVALKFLGSIAEDIVERFNDTERQNLREALKACLLMTDSKCNVPDQLQKELGATQLTLGQYLLKKNK